MPIQMTSSVQTIYSEHKTENDVRGRRGGEYGAGEGKKGMLGTEGGTSACLEKKEFIEE